MKKLSSIVAQLKESVAYKKSVYSATSFIYSFVFQVICEKHSVAKIFLAI